MTDWPDNTGKWRSRDTVLGIAEKIVIRRIGPVIARIWLWRITDISW